MPRDGHRPVNVEGRHITLSTQQGQHHARDITDGLRDYWAESRHGLSTNQRIALKSLRKGLEIELEEDLPKDPIRYPWPKAEIQHLISDVNDLFFDGHLLRGGDLTFSVSDDLRHGGRVAWGLTHRDADASGRRTAHIQLWSALDNKRARHGRAQARTGLITTICHEALHALFYLKSCDCRDCKRYKEKNLDRDEGHGKEFVLCAEAMSDLLDELLGRVMVRFQGVK